MRSSVARRVRPVVDAQLGVITSAQLRALGVDLELPRREGWLRLADGTWSVVPEPTDEQLLVGLRLYSPGALASGALGCRWHGVRYAPRSAGVDGLTSHGRTLLGGPLMRLRQTRRLPDGVLHRGHELAPVDRAVVDAVRWGRSLQDARAVLLSALGDHRLTTDDVEADLRTGPTRTSGLLTRALGDWRRGARSAPEAEAADALLALAGRFSAPPFLLNPELRHDGGLLGCPDGWIPAAGIGWELDSREFHGDQDDLDATLQRHRRFEDAGLVLLHVTPSRLRAAPSVWAADVVRRAQRRLEQGYRPPAGLTTAHRGPVLGAWSPAA